MSAQGNSFSPLPVAISSIRSTPICVFNRNDNWLLSYLSPPSVPFMSAVKGNKGEHCARHYALVYIRMCRPCQLHLWLPKKTPQIPCLHAEIKPTCSFRNNDQTETNQTYPSWKTALGYHPTNPPSSLLGFFLSFALVPQINNIRLILKHLWWLGELLIMKFGYTIWVNIWLRTAKALGASEKNSEYFSINYNTIFPSWHFFLSLLCLFKS